MRKSMFLALLFVVAPACSSLCDAGLGSCPAKKKKGDLKLNNKTDWTIIDTTIQCDLIDCHQATIGPNEGLRFYDVFIDDDSGLVFDLTYQPPADYGSTTNMDVFYNIDMIPDTLTNVDLGGEKAWGNWITPFETDYTLSYPELPPPPPPSSGGTGGGGGDCSAPCAGYTASCSQCGSMACQAPCYCAAACACYYCGGSCEASNRKTASDLGTNCLY